MFPMLGREIKKCRESLPACGQRFNRLGVRGLMLGRETGPGGFALRPGLGIHHLAQCPLGAGLQPLRQFVEYVDPLVTPTALSAGLRPHFASGAPSPLR